MANCKSCGKIITGPSGYGWDRNGIKNNNYCSSCYQNGRHTFLLINDEKIKQNFNKILSEIKELHNKLK